MGGRGAGDRKDKLLPQESLSLAGLLGPSSGQTAATLSASYLATCPHVLSWTLLGRLYQEGVDGTTDELRF